MKVLTKDITQVSVNKDPHNGQYRSVLIEVVIKDTQVSVN